MSREAESRHGASGGLLIPLKAEARQALVGREREAS